MDGAAVRNHIEHKERMGELRTDVAKRMLAALDAGEPADYPALLERATFLPPPNRCYHTAPTSAREQITLMGLVPNSGANWGDKAAGQPTGVYVGPVPDEKGVWSHWPEWDIWEIDMQGLPWLHDRLNPGCWILRDVPTHRLTRIEND